MGKTWASEPERDTLGALVYSGKACTDCKDFYTSALAHWSYPQVVTMYESDSTFRADADRARAQKGDQSQGQDFDPEHVYSDERAGYDVEEYFDILSPAELKKATGEDPKVHLMKGVPLLHLRTRHSGEFEPVYCFPHDVASPYRKLKTWYSFADLRRVTRMDDRQQQFPSQGRRIFSSCCATRDVYSGACAWPAAGVVVSIEDVRQRVIDKHAKKLGGQTDVDCAPMQRAEKRGHSQIFGDDGAVGVGRVLKRKSSLASSGNLAGGEQPETTEAAASSGLAVLVSPAKTVHASEHGDGAPAPSVMGDGTAAGSDLGSAVGLADAIPLSTDDDAEDCVSKYRAVLDLTRAMTSGKLGVQRHHATEAVDKLSRMGKNSDARALKTWIHIFGQAERLNPKKLHRLTDDELKDCVDVVSEQVEIPGTVQYALVRLGVPRFVCSRCPCLLVGVCDNMDAVGQHVVEQFWLRGVSVKCACAKRSNVT
jgi:hypothetical protein